MDCFMTLSKIGFKVTILGLYLRLIWTPGRSLPETKAQLLDIEKQTWMKRCNYIKKGAVQGIKWTYKRQTESPRRIYPGMKSGLDLYRNSD